MADEIRHPTLGERAYLELKNLILSGHFKPGERLLYQQLVRQLGISQTPIKEAFTRLENEGYVVTITRKGTFVRELSTHEVEEIFEIREMLEALAARLVCRARDASAPELLRRINRQFQRAFERRDIKTCTREDFNFHETLIRLSGNGRLQEIMSRTHLHLLSIAQGSPNYFGIAGEYHRMHAGILQAIEDGDEDLAERLMREHIRYGRDQVLPYVESQEPLSAASSL